MYEMSQKWEIKHCETYWMDVDALQWYLNENDTPPMTPPTINIHVNLLFIVEMEVYVY